jgi:hypothetical protein
MFEEVIPEMAGRQAGGRGCGGLEARARICTEKSLNSAPMTETLARANRIIQERGDLLLRRSNLESTPWPATLKSRPIDEIV